MQLEIHDLDLEVKKGLLLLRNVNISVEKGEIVCVIGNNGAGKSSLLRTISGFMKPVRGEILLQGKRITGLPPATIARFGVAHVPEGRRVFARETVKDNLILGAYHRWWRERKKVIKESDEMLKKYPIINRLSSRFAGTLSGGEQQFLAILRGLIMPPVVLLLDEPSLGLAPLIVKEVFEMITECKKSFDLSIILVEQMAYQALNIADRGYVLERGAIVAEGTGKELLNSPSIRKSYLGSVYHVSSDMPPAAE
jgi:branched-chain amino acid transport system ATP-binding protein